MIFGRDRFRAVVARQLTLLAEDEAELLAEASEADAAWTEAPAERSEELYGDYQLVADAVGERLREIREAYARTLDERMAAAYRASFDRTAAKRFGRLASFLEDG